MKKDGLKNEDRSPCHVHCDKCGHAWIVAYAPMDVSKFNDLLRRAACPMCAENKDIFMGHKPAKPVGKKGGGA